ncbi:hypothetical protein [endosymbiont GvMRE of Glomus versiforme]|nr:hypothetical protein [endosymbiont GvMRE of Glomus versiforme]
MMKKNNQDQILEQIKKTSLNFKKREKTGKLILLFDYQVMKGVNNG